MKKFINIFLIILLLLSVCSCGGNNNTEKESSTPLEKAIEEIESKVTFRIKMTYDVVGLPNTNTTVKNLGNGRYQASGYVTFRDSYGNNCNKLCLKKFVHYLIFIYDEEIYSLIL